ncbi:GNAT family N-acetyltransferase [Streptomyces sp. TM32]|uniref:GNAT family N-acetyltransferase n=1 Tax=Streptomyces sp. TM32 TaxID=1652669 RepID=UPI001386F794|nr:GNAT family N-acetyltransferase [Streptomyces sp. TM32]
MHIRLLDARIDDPAYHGYLDAQQRAYSRPGYETLTKYGSTDARTTRDPLKYLAAFDESGSGEGERLVGGIRIHRKIEGHLPSEIHLESQEFNQALADELASGESAAEICGLWVESDWKGRHLGALLCVTAVVAAQRLGATVICGSCPPERIRFYERCGLRFRRDHPLPDRPFPGVTGYYSINRAEAIRHREERLTEATTLLDRALDRADCIPTDVARAAAERLGLGLFTAPAAAGNRTLSTSR